MSQFPIAGKRAVFDVSQNLRLQPRRLRFFDFQRRCSRLQSLRESRDLPFLILAEAPLHLAGVDEAAILPSAEIDAVKLAGLVSDAGDDEGVPLAACDLGPR